MVMVGFHMINLFRKFFSKPYQCSMELHLDYGCYISVFHPSNDSLEGFRLFFEKNHFLIGHNMFDETWDEKTQLQQIFKKLLLIYKFDPNDKNIIVIYKNHKPIYLPNNYCVNLPERGIFVYDKRKIKIFN